MRTKWLSEIWRYRELLYFLAWREVKIRYKQAALGAAWAVLQPLLTMVVFTLFFGRLAGMPSDDIPYPIFAYCALVLWTYHAAVVGQGTQSLIANSNLITKVYFPRVALPASCALSGLFDLLFGLAFLGAMMVYYHSAVHLSWTILFVPLVIAHLVLLAVAFGLLLAALNVRFRDIKYVIPFMLQIWLFVTPVIYPMSFIPERFRFLVALNPLTGIIEAFRACLFGRPFDLSITAISLAVTVFVFVVGLTYFRRAERLRRHHLTVSVHRTMARSIRVAKLAKSYVIGDSQSGMLREAVMGMFRNLLGRKPKADRQVVWALKDVSLEIEQGEVVGLIGRNGAGKSTLLKILSRISYPTTGEVEVEGTVGSLLEVGTGFHDELTGRENIYLNGSILGMQKKEITAAMDRIVEFADVGEFLDTPIKRYSSGMRMRLGFSVAAHLRTDVLFVDEVLAVGDLGFQKKCLGAMRRPGQGRANRCLRIAQHGGRRKPLQAHHLDCRRTGQAGRRHQGRDPGVPR